MTIRNDPPVWIAESTKLQLIEAIRVWHQGEQLTTAQADLIATAQVETLARALGV